MATLPNPHTWTAGDDATSTFLQTLTSAINFLTDPPRCHAYHNSAQTLTTATFTSVTLDSEEVDTDGIHSTVTNTSRFTAVTAGRYLFIGQISYAAGATGYRLARLLKNGGATPAAYNYALNIGASAMGIQVVDEILLGVGDYVELQGWHNQGANLALIAGAGATFLHAKWVSNS